MQTYSSTHLISVIYYYTCYTMACNILYNFFPPKKTKWIFFIIIRQVKYTHILLILDIVLDGFLFGFQRPFILLACSKYLPSLFAIILVLFFQLRIYLVTILATSQRLIYLLITESTVLTFVSALTDKGSSIMSHLSYGI